MTDAYLIAGARGMLGSSLRRVLGDRCLRFVAPPESEFDITSESAVSTQVRAFARQLAPHNRGVLVNAAAYTDVERAEDEPVTAYRVNAEAPALLARAARDSGLAFVHVSTDFVFDGTKSGPYVETDEPRPLSVYGASKLEGERAALTEYPGALIVRTAWVYSHEGSNFPLKVLEKARRGETLRVVTDEVGSPTYAPDLAAGIVSLVDVGAGGLLHLAGSGSCSRFELAQEVLKLAGIDAPVEPVESGSYPLKASRPQNSVLDCGRAARLGVELPRWDNALARWSVLLLSAETDEPVAEEH